eukprot:2142056-Rhodomonas_salina.2
MHTCTRTCTHKHTQRERERERQRLHGVVVGTGERGEAGAGRGWWGEERGRQTRRTKSRAPTPCTCPRRRSSGTCPPLSPLTPRPHAECALEHRRSRTDSPRSEAAATSTKRALSAGAMQ